MLQVIKKNKDISSLLGAMITVTAIVLFMLGSFTMDSQIFDWSSFGLFAALTPFILFCGGVVGIMIAKKAVNKSNFFRGAITLIALAVITTVIYAIIYIVANLKNYYPVTDPLFIVLYGFFTFCMTMPTGIFASQWLPED